MDFELVFSLVLLVAGTLVLVLLMLVEIRAGSPFVVIPAALLAIFQWPHFSNLVFGSWYDMTTLSFASQWSFLFIATYSATRLCLIAVFRTNNRPLLEAVMRRDVSLPRSVLAVGVVFILGALLASMSVTGFDLGVLLATSWGQRRALLGASITGPLSIYLSAAGSVLFIAAWNRRSRLGAIVGAIAIAYFTAVIGTRSYLVALLGPVAVLLLTSTSKKSRRWVHGIAVFACLAVTYVVARGFRHAGSFIDVINNPRLLVGALAGRDRGEFGLIEAFYAVIQGKPYHPVLFNNSGLLRLLLLPLPTSLFPMKPRDIAQGLWDVYTGVIGIGGSYHATVIADSYLNDPSIGFLTCGMVYAILLSAYEWVVRCLPSDYRILLFGVGVTAGLYIARGAVYNGFCVLIYSSILASGAITVARMVSAARVLRKQNSVGFNEGRGVT